MDRFIVPLLAIRLPKYTKKYTQNIDMPRARTSIVCTFISPTPPAIPRCHYSICSLSPSSMCLTCNTIVHFVCFFSSNIFFFLSIIVFFPQFSLVTIGARVGDISGQIEPLLSSFDEPTPLTAIPINAMQLKRLDEEENSSSIQIDDDDDDNDGRIGGTSRDDDDDDDDAKIPLLTSPEVISRVVHAISIHRLRISFHD